MTRIMRVESDEEDGGGGDAREIGSDRVNE